MNDYQVIIAGLWLAASVLFLGALLDFIAYNQAILMAIGAIIWAALLILFLTLYDSIGDHITKKINTWFLP